MFVLFVVCIFRFRYHRVLNLDPSFIINRWSDSCGQLVVSFDFDLTTPGARLPEPAAWGGDEDGGVIFDVDGCASCGESFMQKTLLDQFAPDPLLRSCRWV